MYDEQLARAGLESISRDAESLYPECIVDGDRIWVTVVRDGRRVNLFEISVLTAAKLAHQLTGAVRGLMNR